MVDCLRDTENLSEREAVGCDEQKVKEVANVDLCLMRDFKKGDAAFLASRENEIRERRCPGCHVRNISTVRCALRTIWSVLPQEVIKMHHVVRFVHQMVRIVFRMDNIDALWDEQTREQLKAQIVTSKYRSMRALAADPAAEMAYTTLRRYISGERDIAARDLGRLLRLMRVDPVFFWESVAARIKQVGPH